jgi:DNA invertase Pin-like site-specific DNA recombinase
MEDITKAKERGVYKGRKPSVETSQIIELHKMGMGATAITKELNVSRATIYRAIS